MSIKKTTILLALLVVAGVNAGAQTPKHSPREYAQKPYWIAMIQDTASNYFEVEKAFKLYFEHHEMPEEENDVIGEVLPVPKRVTRREMRKRAAEDEMRMEVRKYEAWRFQMLPYVQEDGTILSPSQRLELWRQGNSKK
jgi:hypothetical protein